MRRWLLSIRENTLLAFETLLANRFRSFLTILGIFIGVLLVVTVASIHAGRASNAIPDEARLEGTLRSFDDGVGRLLRERVAAVLDDVVRAAGCRSEFELRRGFPATVNDAAAADLVRAAAREVVGDAAVIDTPPLTAAEDFSYFLRERPGAFVLVGAGNSERGITAPHHSPEFDIDEGVLRVGASYFDAVVRRALRDYQGSPP